MPPSRSSGLERCSTGAPCPVVSCGQKQDLSGFLVTPPIPLPCSETPAEPVFLTIAAFPMLPPDPTRRRLQHLHDFEATAGLQYPLSTLHERRCRHPCKTRFRLAGSAFTVRASNPLGHDERFQVIPSSFPGLVLTLVGPTYDASSTICTKRPAHRSPPKPCGGSPNSMRSRDRSGAARQRNVGMCVIPAPGHSSR